MKRYSFLLILLLVSTINLSAQVQDRFKTKKQDSTESKQDTTADGARTDDGRRNTPSAPGNQKISGDEKFWDKVVIGGNASLSFGTYTFVYLAPSVGYRFTENLIAGPGFIYQYARISGGTLSSGQQFPTYQNTVYGPKGFVNYLFAERFYGGLQFEYLNHEVPYLAVDPNTMVKYVDFQYEWTPVLFLEAGLVSPIGRKGYAQIGLRYNVLHGPDSPYGSALFPFIGFFF